MATVVMTLAAALSLIGAAPRSASAVTIGIGDQSPAMFSSPAFRALNIHEARITVPWDVMTVPRAAGTLAATAQWLQAAEAAGVTPFVSFAGDGNYIPTVDQYAAAVRAFIRRFPTVKRYAPWNEPDWIYRHLSQDPLLAASFFNALVASCHGCVVLAGDVYLPAGQLGPWLREYKRGLHSAPSGWALHNYHDVRSHTSSQLSTLLSMTTGPVWLDEISGVERRGHWQFANQSEAAAGRDEQFLVSLPRRFPRVSRIYHYQWAGSPSAGWDSGLLNPDGSPRPAYYAISSVAR